MAYTAFAELVQKDQSFCTHGGRHMHLAIVVADVQNASLKNRSASQ